MNKKVKTIVIVAVIAVIVLCIATVIGGIQQGTTPVTTVKNNIPISTFEKDFSIKLPQVFSIKLPQVNKQLYSIEEIQDYRFLFYHNKKVQTQYCVYELNTDTPTKLKKGNIIDQMYPSSDVPKEYNVKELTDLSSAYFLKASNSGSKLYVQVVSDKMYIWQEMNDH